MIKIKKTLLLIGFLISLISYIFAIKEDSIILALAGVPSFLNIIILLHECGHAFACKLNGNRITCIKVPLVKITKIGLEINSTPNFDSYCSFISKKSDLIVYIFGPIFSLLGCLAFLVCSILTNNNVLSISTVLLLMHFLKNMIPMGESDISKIIKTIRHRRRY